MLLVLLISFVGRCLGQEGKIQTERPDQTESTTLMPSGALQLEAGYQFDRTSEAGYSIKTRAYPTALLRFGVLNWLEVRAEGALGDSVFENGTKRKVTGMTPLSLELKFQLWREQGWQPRGAFVSQLVLPVGSRAFRPDHPEPEFRLVLSNILTQRLEVAYNLAIGWADGESEVGYSIVLTGTVHENLAVFGEVLGSKANDEKAEYLVNTGANLWLGPNLQLDLAAATGLSDAAPDFVFRTGFSIRMPH
ncbi:transporter [Pontibacter kalidii]|uniref:transporter n=1 Tax=Pontibacter kalidii TaxID=2592049 RepID=UPI002255128E|nr:transporter [Pontibacter kalidii]